MQLLGEISKNLKEFKNAILGIPTPEEAARKRAEDELSRAFFEGYRKLIERWQDLDKRKQYEFGQAKFLHRSLLNPQLELGQSRDALTTAVVERIEQLDRLKDDWRTLLNDAHDFCKKQPAPPMEPRERMGFAYDLDGIAKAELNCSDMRNAFKAVAIKSGLMCEDEPKILAATEAPVRVMKPLRLRKETAKGNLSGKFEGSPQ